MAKRKRPSRKAGPTDQGTIPPGATRKAFDRPLDPGGGGPGSGAGPRHAVGDPGSPDESTDPVDTNQLLGEAPIPEEQDNLEQGPPYAGPSGGAVGGAPAEGRSRGGRTRHGLAPRGVHRGDSTIGTNPESGAD